MIDICVNGDDCVVDSSIVVVVVIENISYVVVVVVCGVRYGGVVGQCW